MPLENFPSGGPVQGHVFRACVDFENPLRSWDGFGVNYVETAHPPDPLGRPQDYGGLSRLSSEDRRKVIEWVFGDQGLRPGLLKMFQDPLMQASPEAPFEPRPTTEQMRFFAREGLMLTRRRGEDLKIITSLYGAPGWMTVQRSHRGRDLDPAFFGACADYLISFVRFLREEEGMPVAAVTLHNEGDGWWRWNSAGESDGRYADRDYNTFWPPEQVVEFLRLMPARLAQAGLADVRLGPGECSTWQWFDQFGYADAIARDETAVRGLGIVTSHGFHRPVRGFWASDLRSSGTDKILARKPGLPVWTTSSSWGLMDVDFVWEIHHHLHAAKVTGFIPWALVQDHGAWPGGDPNPGCAIEVTSQGTVMLRPGYTLYKHMTWAGRPGTQVIATSCTCPSVTVTAFGKGASAPAPGIVLVNVERAPIALSLELRAATVSGWRVYRSVERPRETASDPVVLDETFRDLGTMDASTADGVLNLPARSVTTLLGVESG